MSAQKRRRVIAGNWKMYKTQADTRTFFAGFSPLVAGVVDCDIVIAPPFTSIPPAVEATRGTKIGISAQNVYWEKEGAFTGEVSTGMLVEAGCRYTIIGHSERRQFFSETNETVLKKTKAALAAGLTPIVCIGEMLADREAGNTEKICETQFRGSFGALTSEEFSRILVAYEPVWAIGTGSTPTPDDVRAMHGFIREQLTSRFGGAGQAVRILYGGSVKPENAKELLCIENVDGALVGGASLNAGEFLAIAGVYP